MVRQPPSEKQQLVSEEIIQPSRLRQQQAVPATAQNNHDSVARQESHLQDSDLVVPDLAVDDVPPPPYGHNYGEIHNEKGGLGTSARVTDDGRVDVRINQLNRRLSQLFTPALRQQVASLQESQALPPPYIASAFGGSEPGVSPPPSLNIVIQVVGSRGDVQPFVALGKVLKNTYGHRVRLATHPIFKDFVQEHGLAFFSIGGDPARLMAFMVQNPGLMPGFRTLMSGDVGQRRRDVMEYIEGCWRSCYKAGDGLDDDNDQNSESAARPFVADCIIANPPSFAHVHCAEKLGIPLHIMFTMPYSPTQAFPHPLANIQSSNADPQLTNYISYVMIEVLTWQGLGDIVNQFRVKSLKLDPVSHIWGPGMLQRLKIPHTYCWSPALIPKPTDWGSQISISGFYFLNLASNYNPDPALQEFLDAGPPPVYIGFGSIVLDDPNAMTELIFDTVRRTRQRFLVSKGWGGIGEGELDIPDGVFMLGNVPHDWLFKHVSCVVHHGGAGTTAAGITAGLPTLVVPFFGDQPFWGAMVARAGAGPDPIPHKQLTADKLTDAINFCLKSEVQERAKELASKIAAEKGCDTGAQSFHQYLDSDRLRCAVAPSRTATWRVKHTEVKLSAFAACTLANADLLDFRDLELFRPQEYQTDEGPPDPVSGGIAATLGTFSGMAMGIAEFPSETYKAVRATSGPSRKQSRATVTTTAKTDETSDAAVRSAPPTTLEPSQSTLTAHQPADDPLIHSNLSGRTSPALSSPPSSSLSLSSLTSDNDPSSVSEAVQGDLSSNNADTLKKELNSGEHHKSGEERGALQRSAVYTSKGLGRMIKVAVKAPMDFSVSMTKGFHNLPKAWGDDTVRPQAKVSGFKSGTAAAGKEFGFGMYDGVTGLFTQPWKGAQKEGASGFFKGFGKGIGGFATKPGAAMFGILGYTLKGIHKEVQKLFSGNVQTYIVASRAAQGYEEWLQSSESEQQDVIARWVEVQKTLKKKGKRDKDERSTSKAQRKKGTDSRDGNTTSSAQPPPNSADAPTHDPESAMLSMGSPSPIMRRPVPAREQSLKAAPSNGSTELPTQPIAPPGDSDDGAKTERSFEGVDSHLQEAANLRPHEDDLSQAIAASEADAQNQASEALEYERQMKLVLEQSLREV